MVVVEGLIDRLARQHHGHRQVAGGQAFREAKKIRGDVRLLAGEQRPGAPEANRDLIGDQVHAMAVAGRARPAQVIGVIHAHAAGALHQRLEDQRRDLLGLRGERRLERVGCARRRGGCIDIGPGGPGVG